MSPVGAAPLAVTTDVYGNPYAYSVISVDAANATEYVYLMPLNQFGQAGPGRFGVIFSPPGQMPIAYPFGGQAPPNQQPMMSQAGMGGYGNPYDGPGYGPGAPGAGYQMYGPPSQDYSAYGQASGMNPNAGNGAAGQAYYGPQPGYPPVFQSAPANGNVGGTTAAQPGSTLAESADSNIPTLAVKAIVDIQEAWATETDLGLRAHVDLNRSLRMYRDGNYQGVIQSTEFLLSAHQSMAAKETQSFVLDHRAVLGDGRVVAWGRRVYDDVNHRRYTSYPAYWLQQNNGAWYIVAINVASTPDKSLVSPEPPVAATNR